MQFDINWQFYENYDDSNVCEFAKHAFDEGQVLPYYFNVWKQEIISKIIE